MKIASLSLVALLAFASPALAAKKAPPKPAEPVEQCHSVDDVTKHLGKDKFVREVKDDAAKAFFKNVFGGEYDGSTFAIYRKTPDEPVIFFVRFKAGCSVGFGALPARVYPAVLEDGAL